MASTRLLKTIKRAKIETRKGDRVNRLLFMLGDKLISHLIASKRQKRRSQISKDFDIVDSRSKSSDLLLEQLRIISTELEKNSVTRRF